MIGRDCLSCGARTRTLFNDHLHVGIRCKCIDTGYWDTSEEAWAVFHRLMRANRGCEVFQRWFHRNGKYHQ